MGISDTFIYSLKAKGDNILTSDSDEVLYEIDDFLIKLDTPTNLIISRRLYVNSKVDWSNVENNNGYILYKDNIECYRLAKDENTSSCELPPMEKHTVGVVAIGDGIITKNSDMASIIVDYKEYKLDNPSDISIASEVIDPSREVVIIWQANELANAYSYSIDNGVTWTETLKRFVTISLDTMGSYNFMVKAVSHSSTMIDSDVVTFVIPAVSAALSNKDSIL